MYSLIIWTPVPFFPPILPCTPHTLCTNPCSLSLQSMHLSEWLWPAVTLQSGWLFCCFGWMVNILFLLLLDSSWLCQDWGRANILQSYLWSVMSMQHSVCLWKGGNFNASLSLSFQVLLKAQWKASVFVCMRLHTRLLFLIQSAEF